MTLPKDLRSLAFRKSYFFDNLVTCSDDKIYHKIHTSLRTILSHFACLSGYILYQFSTLLFACVLGSILIGFRTEIGYKRVPNPDRESIRKSTFRQERHFKPSWTILVSFWSPVWSHLVAFGVQLFPFGSRFGSFWFHFGNICYYFNLVYIFSVRCNLGRLFVLSLLL